ncbi:methylenetetrahydrofolate reductase [Brachybacterium sp. YJGR34]|uniref:methylenetetrahydrofolate reductase n=1 Tax=Brachybacterium sp. YJGR34 TaxID=2059911 RepID=UPI000E0B3601|nr:methylenetetrahydrofolate reductase [Brachybacterium sp. YJGR34]
MSPPPPPAVADSEPGRGLPPDVTARAPAAPLPRDSASSLAAAQFEVIPLPGIVGAVHEHLPPGARVTVTSSPRQGLQATIDTAAGLARAGFAAIPHLAARQVDSRRTLERQLAELTAAGVREVFVIAGDATTPAGPYEGTLALLEEIARTGHRVEIGVGVHPEGHPYVRSPFAATDLLLRKAEHASVLVSQLCFDATLLLDWTRELRRAGIGLPLRPGIAGPVDRGRLLRIGARVGVGPSLKLLAAQGAGMRHLLGRSSWSPDPLLEQLAPGYEDPQLGLAGAHVYTFNALEATGTWWRERGGASTGRPA